MLELEWIGDLDGDAACVAVTDAHSRVLQAQAEEFYLAAHWADLHAGEALADERRRTGRRVLPGMERAKRLGADGTPLVAEFAAMELGALLGMGHVAADHLIRDALNVRHRHPQLWAALAEGRGRVWQARKVAQRCAAAGLDQDQARWVDAQTTPYVASLPWGRFESLVEAKIVEADPDAAEERAKAAAMARFVRTGQSSEYGIKTLIARANAGDVIFFQAMVDRIAQILLQQGDLDSADVRRSKAVGILGNPLRALALLEWGAQQATGGSNANDDAGASDDTAGDDSSDDAGDAGDGSDGGGSDGGGDPEVIGEGDVHPSQNDADDPIPEPHPCPGCGGTGSTTGQLTDQMTGDPTPFTKPSQVDPRKLLPNATLYVHISEEMLRGAEGVARVEGVGPVTRQQVIDFLGHTSVRTVPVLDLASQAPVDGYEVPGRMADAAHLRNPACVSPWASNLSRRKDNDHPVPYLAPDKGGPPGQTGLHNLARLGRFAHRVKTHGRWRLRQTGPGIYEWTSPHGYRFRVDGEGTHPLGKGTNERASAPPEEPVRTDPAGRDGCSRSGRPRRPLTRHVVSVTRVGSGWMETYQAPVTVEVDPSFQRV
jgi:hypothetical protein